MHATAAVHAQGRDTASPATLSALDQALSGSQRSAANKARDLYRHPRETLLFFGLAPEQTVIEIAPGAGWYTEILAPVLRERGRLYAAHYPADSRVPAQREARARFEEKLKKEPAVYDRVVVGSLPTIDFNDIQPAGGADMVLTFRNVHNWIVDAQLDNFLGAFYRVLKPGGVLGVEEHRAAPGTSLEKSISSGYVTEAHVIDRARVAGFELAARSEVNANPRDTKDYPEGVWALPPTFRGGEAERDKVLAIGESDRMTLKFVKPTR